MIELFATDFYPDRRLPHIGPRRGQLDLPFCGEPIIFVVHFHLMRVKNLVHFLAADNAGEVRLPGLVAECGTTHVFQRLLNVRVLGLAEVVIIVEVCHECELWHVFVATVADELAHLDGP